MGVAGTLCSNFFRILIHKGNFLRTIGVVVTLLAVYIGIVLNSGPFEPLTCTFGIGCVVPDVQGKVKPGFEEVKKVFEDQWKRGWMVNGQLVVYHKGEIVVDLWGTRSGMDSSYNGDSLQIVFSSSKVAVATALAVALDKGYLQLDDPVAKYWPEFAAKGKDKITIREVAQHRSGLGAATVPYPVENLFDEDKVASFMADSEIFHTHDTNTSYHAISIGWLLGEIIKRADPAHRSFSKFFAEEVANPLKAGIYFGVPLSEQHRISPVYDASTAWSLIHLAVPLYLGNSPDPVLAAHSLNSSSYIARFLIGAAFEVGNLTLINSPEFQKVYSPATAGFASARGLAKLGAALANKGDTTDSLLLMWLQANMMELGSSPRKQWTRFFNPLLQFMNIVYLTFMTTDTDVVTGSKIAWTQVGWAKGGLPTTMKLMDGFYGWTGLGGSGFLFSPEKQAAVGFTVTGLDRTEIVPSPQCHIGSAINRALEKLA